MINAFIQTLRRDIGSEFLLVRFVEFWPVVAADSSGSEKKAFPPDPDPPLIVQNAIFNLWERAL